MSSFRVRAAFAPLLLAAAACGGEITPTGPGPTVVLTLPASVSDIRGGLQSEQHFRFVVPAGKTRLDVVASGGVGDVDLYVRYNQAPTPALSDCRPNETGSGVTETCAMVDPNPGDWYVALVGYTPYSGVTLTITVTPP
jgi:vibriolysin